MGVLPSFPEETPPSSLGRGRDLMNSQIERTPRARKNRRLREIRGDGIDRDMFIFINKQLI